ncbi:TonB-linked outer membrane protein, SusC/RagA family [Bacteroidales bacterium KHT7]|nr:TonB-linked outer membrane protein, SusC/RagA family [Bacteroidales bacterium KHT7]
MNLRSFGEGNLLFAALFCSAFAGVNVNATAKSAPAISAEEPETVFKGTVVDNSGSPIIGANILVKGTSTGTISDFNGDFMIKCRKTNLLEISYIGYITQTVKVSQNMQVVLAEDDRALDEVVVVGYGVQRKTDVTGSMARVGEKELKAMPVSNALEGMQGRAAGVDITNSQRPGEVGGINIRGVRSLSASPDPLYVVDGMITSNDLSSINPADIESVDVLKDASATAIYGSRGANGVVLITTKKGKEGKVSVNYSGTVKFETLSDVAEYMSAAEWLDYSRLAKYSAIDSKTGKRGYESEIGSNGKIIPVESIDKNLYGSVAASWANIEKAYASGSYNPALVGEYDWASHGKRTGVTHDHNINFSGGTEKIQAYGSFGYLNQKSVQPGQEYTRYSAKVTFDAEPLPYLKLGASINGAYTEQDYGYSFTKSVTGAGDYYNALRGMLPWSVPYDENGDYIRNPNADVNIINPINELDLNVNQRKRLNVSGVFYADVNFGKMWKPLEGLRYRVQFGPEFRQYETGTMNKYGSINSDYSRKGSWARNQDRNWVLDNLIYYDKVIADVHKIGITLMQSATKKHYDTMSMSNSALTSDTELWYNLGTPADNMKAGSGYSESQMASYMARLNYSFMDRYLLTASVRRDGSSVLSAGHKWDSFGSVALGWRIDQEEFMQDVDWVSQLKLRAGYGSSGSSAINPYDTKGGLQELYYHWGNTSALGYLGSDASAKNPNMMANQNVGWERTTQTNIGVDFAVFKSRISGSIDYYINKTDDILTAMKIPSISGYTTTMANVAASKGWGIDVQLSAIPYQGNGFRWTTTLTWSKDKSEITELANGATEDWANKWFVGEEILVFADYVYDGIWTTAEEELAKKYNRKVGQIKVKDLDGDGDIDADDRCKSIGSVRPSWSGGWNNTLTYKNWELSFFIFSRWGFTVNQGALTLDGRFMQRKIDYFVPGYNENAEYYQPGINGESQDQYQSCMNYQDGSYIKLRNVSLGYSLSPKQLNGTGLSNLKIYAQLMNPCTLYSKCKWLDTDLMNYDNNTRILGSTTTIRGFVIGLNIGF